MNTKINILSRNDMKSIKAGYIPEYICDVPGYEYFGCVGGSLIDCLALCHSFAYEMGIPCWGCGEVLP